MKRKLNLICAVLTLLLVMGAVAYGKHAKPRPILGGTPDLPPPLCDPGVPCSPSAAR